MTVIRLQSGAKIWRGSRKLSDFAWAGLEAKAGTAKDGSMDTIGMGSTKGNIKREKDGAPAPVKQDDTKK